MTFISLADTIQLIIHCYGGLITIFDNSFHPFLEKVYIFLINYNPNENFIIQYIYFNLKFTFRFVK